ncbi:hypothetical protein HYE09_01500 [Mycoplasmopsis bovis]|nr:hypothetical protein [Mycoplasmopsis bovis]QQH26827.1 hypothetical protein HYE09_01500 [Mycoplasmopsis bovis]
MDLYTKDQFTQTNQKYDTFEDFKSTRKLVQKALEQSNTELLEQNKNLRLAIKKTTLIREKLEN